MLPDKKDIQNILRGLGAALPALPFVMRRRRTNTAAYVLGAIGLAVAGGIVALLLMPRARRRALTTAKDTYGKLNEKVHQIREHDTSTPISNGLMQQREDYPTSGL